MKKKNAHKIYLEIKQNACFQKYPKKVFYIFYKNFIFKVYIIFLPNTVIFILNSIIEKSYLTYILINFIFIYSFYLYKNNKIKINKKIIESFIFGIFLYNLNKSVKLIYTLNLNINKEIFHIFYFCLIYFFNFKNLKFTFYNNFKFFSYFFLRSKSIYFFFNKNLKLTFFLITFFSIFSYILEENFSKNKKINFLSENINFFLNDTLAFHLIDLYLINTCSFSLLKILYSETIHEFKLQKKEINNLDFQFEKKELKQEEKIIFIKKTKPLVLSRNPELKIVSKIKQLNKNFVIENNINFNFLKKSILENVKLSSERFLLENGEIIILPIKNQVFLFLHSDNNLGFIEGIYRNIKNTNQIDIKLFLLEKENQLLSKTELLQDPYVFGENININKIFNTFKVFPDNSKNNNFDKILHLLPIRVDSVPGYNNKIQILTNLKFFDFFKIHNTSSTLSNDLTFSSILNSQENISLVNINRFNPSISSISNNTNLSLTSFIERTEEIIFSNLSIPWSQQLLSENLVFDSFTFEISSTRRSYNNLVEPLNWQLNLQNFSIIRNLCFFNFNYFTFSTNIFAFKQFLIIAVFLCSFVTTANSRPIPSRNSNNLSTNINLTNYNRTIDPYSLTQSNSTILQPTPYISYLAAIIFSSVFISIIVLSQITALRINCFPSLSSFNCFSPRRRYFSSPSERSLSRSSSHISRASQRNLRDLNDPSEPNPTLSRSVSVEILIESQEAQRIQSEDTITQGELQPQETSQAEEVEEHELQEQSKLLEQSSFKEQKPLEDLNLFQEIAQEKDTRENTITKNTDNIGSSSVTENQLIFPVNFVESYTHKGEAIEFQEQTVETSLDPPDVASFEIESLASEISMDSEQDISETAEISDSISESQFSSSEKDLKSIFTGEYIETDSIVKIFQKDIEVTFKVFKCLETLKQNNQVLVLVCVTCEYSKTKALNKQIKTFLKSKENPFNNYKLIEYDHHHIINRRDLLCPYKTGITTSWPRFLNIKDFEKKSSEVLSIKKDIESFNQLEEHLKNNYRKWFDSFFKDFHLKHFIPSETPASISLLQEFKLFADKAIELQVKQVKNRFTAWNISEKNIFIVTCLDKFLQDIQNINDTLTGEIEDSFNGNINFNKESFSEEVAFYHRIITCLQLLIFNFTEVIPLHNEDFWGQTTTIFSILLINFNRLYKSHCKYFEITPRNFYLESTSLQEHLTKFQENLLFPEKNINLVKELFLTEFIKIKSKDDQGRTRVTLVSVANSLCEPFRGNVRLEALCEIIIIDKVFQVLCPNLFSYLQSLNQKQ